MKCLLISSYPTEGCGVSKYTKELSEALSKNGVATKTLRLNFMYNPFFSIFSFPQLLFKILKEKAEIIHFQYTPTITGPLILLILLALKAINRNGKIITCHEKPESYLYQINSKLFKNIYIIFEKTILHLADKIIVHTNEHKNRIVEMYGLKENQIVVISHGVALRSKPQDDDIIQFKKKFPENGIILTYFGTVRPTKGIEGLIKAFSEIQNCKNDIILIIAGEAPKRWKHYFEELKCLAHSLKIEEKIHFMGFVDESEIPLLMTISDIIVLPYIHSTQSGVLFREVIPYAKPVIVSDTGGLGEIVKKMKIGLTFTPGDIESLTDKILLLINDNTIRKLIIEKQKLLQQQLSWKNIAKDHKKIYNSFY